MTGAAEPERLRGEIEQTRQALGETVEALSAKTDVKAHAKARLERTKSTVAKPLPLVAAATAATGLALWRVAAHRRAARQRQPTLAGRAGRLVARPFQR
jgi:hypothetical protein